MPHPNAAPFRSSAGPWPGEAAVPAVMGLIGLPLRVRYPEVLASARFKCLTVPQLNRVIPQGLSLSSLRTPAFRHGERKKHQA